MIEEIKKILKATNVCQCVDNYTCEVCKAIEQSLKQSQEKIKELENSKDGWKESRERLDLIYDDNVKKLKSKIDKLEREIRRLNDYAKRLIDEGVKYNNRIDELEKALEKQQSEIKAFQCHFVEKEEIFKEVDKEFNITMHRFGKLMAEYKVNIGVCTKLLVPFMRFHIKIKKQLKHKEAGE